MAQPLPEIHLVRHGETAWTISRQHTGLTDIPLTERGERDAYRLGEHLRGKTVKSVFTSPLQRARRTCELAGFGAAAVVDPDLVEWDYGEFEGLTTAQIREHQPDWNLWRDGCPGGESVANISARADRMIARLRALDGDVGVFSSGHFSRVVAARWLGLDASCGRFFALSTTTLSVLGYEHDKSDPVIKLWNDARPGMD
ncbi:MAG: histidine phosphatase family protein [Tepidisphaeraceae bacterium]